MAKAVNSDQLRAASEKHAGETRASVCRVFKLMKQSPKAEPALLSWGGRGGRRSDREDSPALEAGLLSGAQAVEHKYRVTAR
jgi:ferritin-like metal-binding protein YciE